MKPYMNQNEIELFRKYLLKTKKYLEFGAGGSTKFAIDNGVENIFSIETDQDWISKLKNHVEINNKLIDNTLHIEYLNLNCIWWKHVSWKEKCQENPDTSTWSQYHSLVNKCTFEPDMILVDGRFRVASALESVKLMSDNTFLLFHDYVNRPQYHVIEDFFDKIEVVHTLQVFKRKENIDLDKLNDVIKKYELVLD